MTSRRRKLEPDEKTRMMRSIKSHNTKPETIVRKLIHSMGYRYRLHYKKLPGKPDIVFVGRRKVIFVHGCFWHLHTECKLGKMPKNNLEYWKGKLEGNVKRDVIVQEALQEAGWDVLVIWECEVKDVDKIKRKVIDFLEN